MTLVYEDSPASACGMLKDDEILEFGSINHENFRRMEQISELIRHRKDQPIALKVKRQNQNHDITLIPKTWSGRGLLGCNIMDPKWAR